MKESILKYGDKFEISVEYTSNGQRLFRVTIWGKKENKFKYSKIFKDKQEMLDELKTLKAEDNAFDFSRFK